MPSPILETLKLELERLGFSNDSTLWIGYSGGLDSHVLLHALKHLQPTFNYTLKAIHIHHGIHSKADEWTAHCLKVGNQLAQLCEVIKVNVASQPKQSLEESARNARYGAFQSLLNENDYVVTAHHADDQAETFLLQLLRGAGTKGLSAMPLLSRLGKGFLWRPLLSVSRETLQTYATLHQLPWIEDESNSCLDFDRNYLRHAVIPSLKSRWPHFVSNTVQSALHCADAEVLLAEMTQEDFLKTREDTCLLITELQKLTRSRRHNVLRYWLKQQKLPLPNRTQLAQFETDFLLAQPDAKPILRWSTVQLRRHQNYLYILPSNYRESIHEIFKWNLLQPLELPNQIGHLAVKKIIGQGIHIDHIENKNIEIRFRKGGETIQLRPHNYTKTLKNLFHELNIPHWERSRIPLAYINNELAQIVLKTMTLTAKKFSAENTKAGFVIYYL